MHSITDEELRGLEGKRGVCAASSSLPLVAGPAADIIWRGSHSRILVDPSLSSLRMHGCRLLRSLRSSEHDALLGMEASPSCQRLETRPTPQTLALREPLVGT